jgi:hypothetical protein
MPRVSCPCLNALSFPSGFSGISFFSAIYEIAQFDQGISFASQARRFSRQGLKW